MADPKVFFVHLRQPGSIDPRTDPLYEFGSFGCTKCHRTNLFHPRHAEDLKGSRLAFVQCGDGDSRLVFLTPPITVNVWAENCEARWVRPEMPFKYTEAPVLVANDGRTDFPLVKELASRANRSTLVGGLSSRLRTRSKPLPPKMAGQVISVYERYRKESEPSAIAEYYYEALPYYTEIDHNREATYHRLIGERGAETNGEPVTLNDDVTGGVTRSATGGLPARAFDTLKHDSSSLHWQQVASGTRRIRESNMSGHIQRDATEYLAELEAGHRKVAKKLLESLADQLDAVKWQPNFKFPGILLIVQRDTKEYEVCRMTTDGHFVFRFYLLKKTPPFTDDESLMGQLQDQIKEDFGDDVFIRHGELRNRARIQYKKLTTSDAREKLESTVRTLIKQVKAECE